MIFVSHFLKKQAVKLIWCLAFYLVLSSSYSFALTFKSGQSVTDVVAASDWRESIKTSLHDADISGANFDFVNTTFLNALEQFSEYRMPAYGWDVEGTDPGASERGGVVKQFDCALVMKNLQVEFMKAFDNPLYNQSCSYMYRRGFFSGGLEEIQDLLNHWAAQESGYYDIDLSQENRIYARQVSMTHMATTYAVFYDLFDNHDAINSFFKSWLLENQSNKRPDEKVCPFNNPRSYRTQGGYAVDACGSNHWRAAVSNIALGLRLQDRDLYISGVKHLEINLSMYDKNGIFVPYASRGWDAPGYAIDNDEHIGAVAFLLETAGIDLYEVEMSSGQKVKSLIEGHQAWLRDPTLASDYILGTLTCNNTCERFTDFAQAGSLDQWRQDKQFSEEDILLRSFHYQMKFNKDRFPDTLSLVDIWTEHQDLPDMYIWGQNNAFPLIFAVMSKAGDLNSYMESLKQAEDTVEQNQNQEQLIEDDKDPIEPVIFANLGLMLETAGFITFLDESQVQFAGVNYELRKRNQNRNWVSYRFKFDKISGLTNSQLGSQNLQRLNDIFRYANPTYFLKREDGRDEISAMADIDHILGQYETSRAAWETIHAICPIDPNTPYDAIEIPIQHKSWLVPALGCIDENLDDEMLKLLIQLMVSAAEGISADMY